MTEPANQVVAPSDDIVDTGFGSTNRFMPATTDNILINIPPWSIALLGATVIIIVIVIMVYNAGMAYRRARRLRLVSRAIAKDMPKVAIALLGPEVGEGLANFMRGIKK